MRKVALVLMMLIAVPLYAEEETLFHGKVEHGGFGAPVVKFTQIKDEFGVLVGGRGGWIINHNFVLGGGGYGLANHNIDEREITPDSILYLALGYGGVEMEYICRPHKLVHLTFQALIGAGWVSYQEKYRHHRDENNFGLDGDAFFITEPGFNAELNVTTFFRADVGAGYRFVSGVNSDWMKNSDLAGPSVNVTLKFGKF